MNASPLDFFRSFDRVFDGTPVRALVVAVPANHVVPFDHHSIQFSDRLGGSVAFTSHEEALACLHDDELEEAVWAVYEISKNPSSEDIARTLTAAMTGVPSGFFS